MSTESIIIQKFAAVNCGNLRALADIRTAGGTVIRRCRIVQETGKRAWFSLPISTEQINGEKKTFTILTVPDALKADINKVLLERARREGVINE